MENQLTRWGALSKVLPIMNPKAKVFLVGKAALDYIGDTINEFPADKDGVTRVCTTLAAALALASGTRGDKILALPGHTEKVSSSTALTLSVAGVGIIGKFCQL